MRTAWRGHCPVLVKQAGLGLLGEEINGIEPNLYFLEYKLSYPVSYKIEKLLPYNDLKWHKAQIKFR